MSTSTTLSSTISAIASTIASSTSTAASSATTTATDSSSVPTQTGVIVIGSSNLDISPVTAVFICLGVVGGCILLHLALTVAATRIAKRTPWLFDDDLVALVKWPSGVIFPTAGILITLPLLNIPSGTFDTVNHVFVIILLLAVSYLVVQVVKCGSLAVSRMNANNRTKQPKRAREVDTQIVVITRILQGMVWLTGLAGVAMTFPTAWQVGVSLLASAGASALLLGLAAKPSIENALASLNIALTQPFLLEDEVVVNGEIGFIEEIQAQYVVLRTLDERRLIIPLIWFISNIFQNWSRKSSRQVAEAKIMIPMDKSISSIRSFFTDFAKTHACYDNRRCEVLVTNCPGGGSVELTCRMSIASSVDVIQISSDIREAMVAYLTNRQDQEMPPVHRRVSHYVDKLELTPTSSNVSNLPASVVKPTTTTESGGGGKDDQQLNLQAPAKVVVIPSTATSGPTGGSTLNNNNNTNNINNTGSGTLPAATAVNLITAALIRSEGKIRAQTESGAFMETGGLNLQSAAQVVDQNPTIDLGTTSGGGYGQQQQQGVQQDVIQMNEIIKSSLLNVDQNFGNSTNTVDGSVATTSINGSSGGGGGDVASSSLRYRAQQSAGDMASLV